MTAPKPKPVQVLRQQPQAARQQPQAARRPPPQIPRQPVQAPNLPVQAPRQEPRQRAGSPISDQPPNPFKVDFADFDAALAHREEPQTPRRPPPPQSRPSAENRGDAPPNPFKVDFASFDPSLSHGGAPEREPVPLSDATFVVGAGGRVSGSARRGDNEIPNGNGDFFGPFQSVNLGEGFDPAANADLPVFEAIPGEGERPPPPSPRRGQFGPFQVVNF